MQLILVRHAPAELRAEDGGTQSEDGLRALTTKGRRRMRRAARGLVLTVPMPHMLATSPLVRAVETAEIIGDAYDRVLPETITELQPRAGTDAVIAWLKRLPPEHRVIAVGHEPDLSILAGVLLVGRQSPVLSFKKGAACFLRFEADVKPGTAVLEWFMAPRQLRQLGAGQS